MMTFFESLLHIDEYLLQIVNQYGAATYFLLFAIIFAETGLVFFPFLPGDSLLFASGAIASMGALNIWILLPLLWIAAVLGDTVNYWIGHYFGEKIINSKKIPLIKPSHIAKTEEFYEKHGAKMIVLARFVPIVRTFAPFVAGIGKMDYHTFISYNIIGATLWILLFTLLGYFFGTLPIVQNNFELVIVVIILISVVPMIYEWWKEKQKSKTPSSPQV